MFEADEDSITRLTRRSLFAAVPLAALPVADALAAVTPHPDAALLAAWGGYVAANRAFIRGMVSPGIGTDADHAPYYAAIAAYADLIEATPARTMAGMAVQLRYLCAAVMECGESFDAAVLGQPVSRDLAERVAGDHRHALLWAMADAASRAAAVPGG